MNKIVDINPDSKSKLEKDDLAIDYKDGRIRICKVGGFVLPTDPGGSVRVSFKVLDGQGEGVDLNKIRYKIERTKDGKVTIKERGERILS